MPNNYGGTPRANDGTPRAASPTGFRGCVDMRELPIRKANRLKNYDYNQNGAYFITICIKDRREILGNIVVGDAALGVPIVKQSKYGEIINTFIENIPKINPEIYVPCYVIMPNHVHMILIISITNNDGTPNTFDGTPRAASPTKSKIPKIINSFKGLSSKRIGFSLWQRSYHYHIIRSDQEYIRIVEYIESNPMLWKDDCFYPK
jgi:REP element-mobilizing transposase RayT